jgi:hypothetical protein
VTGRGERARRIGWRAVLVAASLVTVLCVGLLLAAIRNDNAVSGAMGTANAQVESVSLDRTIINFLTPDGLSHSPPNGVLYPEGLAAGDVVRIEYDVDDPELARVAGRNASVTLLPLGTTVLFTWLVAGPLVWWLRRLGRQRTTETPKAPAHAGA